MKHLKYFEHIDLEESEITIGDYVSLKIRFRENTPYSDTYIFMNNNIGRLLKIDDNNWDDFLIGYDNVPDNIKNNFHEKDYTRKHKKIYYTKWINSDRVEEYAKSKEELQLKIDTKKYNL
jgi:hypothetical protein